jgi:hypothetical protein
VKIALSVDALTPPLTGIGRYCWELCRGLKNETTIDQVDFVHSGFLVANPASLLEVGSRAKRAPEAAFLSGCIAVAHAR